MTSIKAASCVVFYRWSTLGGADLPKTVTLARDPAVAAIPTAQAA